MAKVNSVIDTILGEATHGTPQQRYKDMVAIASVIQNRAKATGRTPQEIVSVKSQFNAYGGSLPKGASAYRDLAEKAWADVEQNGPVHNATFYATPSASKNLPKGLQQVTQTKGHVYYSDPKNRAIKTAAGFVTPVANAVSRLSDAAIKTVDTVTAPARNVASALAMAAFPSVSRPELPSRPMAPIAYSMGPKRPNPPSPGLVGRVQQAVTDTLGPGYGVNITSGQGQYGSSRHRDPNGIAADVQVIDLSTNRPVTNPQQMMDVAQAFAAQGGKGVGYGPEYMGLGTMHLDTVTPGPGQDFEWGSLGNKNAGLLADARNSALMPASFYDRNLPGSMAVPSARPSPAPSSLVASPSGTVTRSPLGPAAPRSPDPSRFAYDVTPPSQPGGFSLVSQANAAPMPNRPVTTPTTSRLPAAPAVARPSRPITPTPASALAAMNKPAIPSSLMSPTAIGVPQALAPMQTVQPTFVPAAVPAPPMAPPRTIQQRPVYEVPQPAPQPRNTAMDVYNGLANEGFANDGSKITRDQFGGTSITNKFGVTTTTLANGKTATSRNAPAPGISGPLGGNIGTALDKTFTADPALNGRSPFGNFARQTGGRFAGAAVGSVLGPVGSILGSLIGQELAKPNGGKIGDFVNGVRTVDTSMVPGFGPTTQFARAVSGGQFPNAPNVSGALGGRQSNRSGEAMRDISPAAARDISRGRGGLF